MKKIHALTLATALVFGATAAMAQSAPPNSNAGKGTESDKSSTVKANGADQAKKGATTMTPSSGTTGAAVQANDAKAGATKDKGGLANPSKNENEKENKAGRQ